MAPTSRTPTITTRMASLIPRTPPHVPIVIEVPPPQPMFPSHRTYTVGVLTASGGRLDIIKGPISQQ
ncbi:hypothetical protein PanWU01x14_075400 [Parasponia andersonii]|uniref:Uncharacterized protein n=1 Tax=Parasponia andersonii TaxID=3476 RepID=A0A2P5DCT3_PARAD|nr:hypothetical protein PanWU01x14_075400 [Parasponia andersonii]